MNAFRVAVLLFVSAVATSFAADTNTLPTTITVDGITYSNVTWRTVTPATVSILHATGAASIPLERLPPELQKQFGYDPKKAAAYNATARNAEAAYWEGVRKQRADDARRLAEITAKQEAEIATNQAIEAAAKQAADAAAKKTAQDFEARLGSVMTLKFSYADSIKALPDGTYSANLWYSDDQGLLQNLFVTFPAAGLTFVRNSRAQTLAPNAWMVFGRPYTTELQNTYFNGDVLGGVHSGTAYWLVGMRLTLANGSNYPTW